MPEIMQQSATQGDDSDFLVYVVTHVLKTFQNCVHDPHGSETVPKATVFCAVVGPRGRPELTYATQTLKLRRIDETYQQLICQCDEPMHWIPVSLLTHNSSLPPQILLTPLTHATYTTQAPLGLITCPEI